MNSSRQSIKHQISTDCQAFIDLSNGLTEEQFTHQPGGKWSIAEVIQHLYLSARPVVYLMAGPREVMDQWGSPAGPSQSYEEIAEAYQKALRLGVKAPANMSPRLEDTQVGKAAMLERFTGVYEALLSQITTWPDEDLDRYLIPHPALGKLTIREMLYFVSIHTQHHFFLLARA